MLLDPVIPFELHLTVNELNTTALPDFIKCCEENESKPLLIELSRGSFMQQPMLTKTISLKTLEEALLQATDLSARLNEKKFPVKRLKIEIPAYCADNWAGPQQAFIPYFEWHGKIPYSYPERLHELCEQHRVHLSLNVLKYDPDMRFITLREYGTYAFFLERIQQLTIDLNCHGWPPAKQQAEYCVYDNNVFLDNGWLPL